MLLDPELHYLDNAATTMVDPEIAGAIHKALLYRGFFIYGIRLSKGGFHFWIIESYDVGVR